MYKAVLFDLDGTLLDTGAGVIKSVQYVIENMQLPMLPPDELKKFVGPPIRAKMREVFHLTDADAGRAMDMFRDHYGQGDIYVASIYDGIPTVLRTLRQKGLKTGVATYKREDQAKKLLAKFELDCLFDVIHGSDRDGILTKADVVSSCIRDLEVIPDEAVMIGDSDNDAIGAKQAGLHFIGVTYGFGFKKKEDVYSYDNIGAAGTCDEILNYIRQ